MTDETPQATGEPRQDGAGIITGEVPKADATPADWSAHIPQEYATEKLWEPLKGKPLGDVLKSYAEGQKRFGSAVQVPGEHATPEERARFHKQLGVPDDPTAYDLGPAFRDVKTDDPVAKSFRGMAKTAGLTPGQVLAVTGFYQEMLGAGEARVHEANEQGEKALKGEWGATFDARSALAAQAARQLGGDAVINLLDQYGLGSHPAIVKMFERVGREMVEDGAIVQDEQGIVGARQATDKINEVMKDPKHPYFNREHPDHAAAVQQMTAWHRIKAAIES